MGNKILIADDSKLIVSLVRSIFEDLDENFLIISANDGNDALLMAQKKCRILF